MKRGRQLSDEMPKARELLRADDTMSKAEAARQTGLNKSTIGRDKICKAIIASREVKPKEAAMKK
jgi:hypothetical protein